jgi:hypothetical protein
MPDPDKHPPITGDWHWRALARKHEFALLVPMYQVAKNCDEWNDPDSGSERALFTALEDFRSAVRSCGDEGRAVGAVGALRRLKLVGADDFAATGTGVGGFFSWGMSQAIW